MADSLLLVEANLELIGASVNPEYRLGQIDLGAPEPDSATIKSILLDGDQVTSARTGNRSFNLTIPVFSLIAGSTAPIRTQLTQAVDTLLTAIAQPTFTLRWTPDNGLPEEFDCFRGRGQRNRSIKLDNQGSTPVTLTFQAKPFGRSTDLITIPAPASQLQIDSFDTTPATGGTQDTSVKYEGTASSRVVLTDNPSGGRHDYHAAQVSRAFAAKDISAMETVILRVRPPVVSASSTHPTGPYSQLFPTLSFTLTLFSSGGSSKITSSATPLTNTSFVPIPFQLSLATLVSGTGVNLAAVTSYTIDASMLVGSTLYTSSATYNTYYDDLRAVPASSTAITSTHATSGLLPAIVGSARTPANFALSNGSTFSWFLLHSPPPDQDLDARILYALSNATTDQTVTSVLSDTANYNGTYTLLLGTTPGSGAQVVTVTVTQRENGAQVGAQKVFTLNYTAGNKLIPVGDVTLPLYAVPDDNTATDYTFRVQVTGSDRFTELMLADTRGQTIFTTDALVAGIANVYVDEPTALQSGSNVYASATARDGAYSVIGSCFATGGPIVHEPGIRKVLAWVGAGAPVLTESYKSRWQDERRS